MAAERNFFHRWRGMTTIGYELGVIWEMSVKEWQKLSSGRADRTGHARNGEDGSPAAFRFIDMREDGFNICRNGAHFSL